MSHALAVGYRTARFELELKPEKYPITVLPDVTDFVDDIIELNKIILDLNAAGCTRFTKHLKLIAVDMKAMYPSTPRDKIVDNILWLEAELEGVNNGFLPLCPG